MLGVPYAGSEKYSDVVKVKKKTNFVCLFFYL